MANGKWIGSSSPLFKVYVLKRGDVCRAYARRVKRYPVNFPLKAIAVSVQQSSSPKGAKQNVGWGLDWRNKPAGCTRVK